VNRGELEVFEIALKSLWDSSSSYYTQRSSAGLLVTEATGISTQGNGWVDAPGIQTDEMVEGWKTVTSAVHSKGGHIFLQLWHMGRASHSSFNEGKLPVAPSALAIEGEQTHTYTGKAPYEVPRALETDEIPGIVEDYKKGAINAMAAGFDGVEIHGANGYLVDQFLQAKTNKRTDKYGGSIENQYQFLKEIVEAILTVVPSHKVGLRLSPNGAYNGMGTGEFRELFTYVLEQLNQYNLAYVHLMDGLGFGFHKLGEPFTLADARKVFKGPVIGNVGYTQETAEETIARGDADLIAFGRPFISNPDLVERFANGWPLAEPAPYSDWYTPSPKGYTDFPTYKAQ